MLSTRDFLRLDKSTEIKVIGDYPQVIGIQKKYSLTAKKSIEVFGNYKGRIPPFEPDLKDCLILHPKSTYTDLVSCSLGPGNDIIISAKLKLLLEKFSHGPMIYYPCHLYQKNKEIGGYYWVHFIYDLIKDVNFKMSKFHIGNIKVNISSYDNYLRFSEEEDQFGFLRAIELKLPSLFKSLDFFMIGNFDQNIYVSKKLASILLSEKITGIKIG